MNQQSTLDLQVVILRIRRFALCDFRTMSSGVERRRGHRLAVGARPFHTKKAVRQGHEQVQYIEYHNPPNGPTAGVMDSFLNLLGTFIVHPTLILGVWSWARIRWNRKSNNVKQLKSKYIARLE